MLGHIVGFEIAVTKLEAKFKLSQNRTRNEQQHVIDSLSRRVRYGSLRHRPPDVRTWTWNKKGSMNPVGADLP